VPITSRDPFTELVHISAFVQINSPVPISKLYHSDANDTLLFVAAPIANAPCIFIHVVPIISSATLGVCVLTHTLNWHSPSNKTPHPWPIQSIRFPGVVPVPAQIIVFPQTPHGDIDRHHCIRSDHPVVGPLHPGCAVILRLDQFCPAWLGLKVKLLIGVPFPSNTMFPLTVIHGPTV
jgi:hypothetical protein